MSPAHVSDSILWAPISWGHTGARSAMGPLVGHMESLLPGRIQRVPDTLRIPRGPLWLNRLRRALGRPAVRPPWETVREKGFPCYREASWFLEGEIDRFVRAQSPAAVMLEAVEDQFHRLADFRRSWPHTRLVGVCHQPPAWWRLHPTRPETLAALDTLIVVSTSMRRYWEQFLAPEKIVVVPLGVDAEFFCPAPAPAARPDRSRPLRAVLSGQWLRDFDTLADVVALLDQRRLPVHLDLIVPRFARDNPACYRLAMSPNVTWHAGLTDEQLRNVYRSADVLLMTMRDSTANCGMVEGMACGLPVLVTDVGGVRDYTQSSFADVFPPRDPAAVVARLEHHLEHRDLLPARSAAARQYVEQHLAWPKVAARYAALLNSSPA